MKGVVRLWDLPACIAGSIHDAPTQLTPDVPETWRQVWVGSFSFIMGFSIFLFIKNRQNLTENNKKEKLKKSENEVSKV